MALPISRMGVKLPQLISERIGLRPVSRLSPSRLSPPCHAFPHQENLRPRVFPQPARLDTDRTTVEPFSSLKDGPSG